MREELDEALAAAFPLVTIDRAMIDEPTTIFRSSSLASSRAARTSTTRSSIAAVRA